MGQAPSQYTLAQFFSAALATQKALAIWRLPNAQQAEACVQLSGTVRTGHPQLESSPFGFFFCPFQVSEESPNVFIRGDISFAGGQLCTTSTAPAQEVTLFRDALQEQQQRQKRWHSAAGSSATSFQSEAGFQEAVAVAVEEIAAGKMEKVVLSRSSAAPLPEHFTPVAAFKAMAEAYPRAFVSLVSVPGVGTWMGASPEILVSIDQDRTFHTVALAGTQPAVANVSEAIWRQKEIEEQAMVERYILNCFKRLRLRDYTETGPRTVVAGNLMHLRTDFKVDMNEVHFPTLGTDMLDLLHPTSAVCGLPKEPALAFILQHEGYQRSYYSGYLGPVNGASGTHLYVNLRCMELQEQQAVLYAGAGITAESDAAKEWQETQHKMQTMQQILTTFNGKVI